VVPVNMLQVYTLGC